MLTRHHVLVLLDPSSELGERSLDYALTYVQPPVTIVTLFVTLSGQMADPLHVFASSEAINLPSAAQSYLDRLANRIRQQGLEVVKYSALGHDLAADISTYAKNAEVGVIVAPSRIARLDPAFVPRVAASLDIPVIVMPAATPGWDAAS